MTAHTGRHGAATQPLAGVRVVNLGWIWAAPALAGAMADMGARAQCGGSECAATNSDRRAVLTVA